MLDALLSGSLNGLLVASAAWCARRWIGGFDYRRKIVAATLIAGVLATLVFAGLIRPGELPADWFTPLQEGNSLETLSALHGRNAHAGGNFRAVQELVAGRSILRAGDVMLANLWLSAMAMILFAAIAQAVLRNTWATLAFTLVFVGNRNAVDVAVSDLPAPLLSCYLTLGVLAVAAFWEDFDALKSDGNLPTKRMRGWPSLITLGLLCVAAAWTRLETVIVPAGALAALSVVRFMGPQAPQNLGNKLLAGSRWLINRPLPILVVLIAVLAVPWWSGPETARARWLYDAVWPLNLSPVLLFPRALDVIPAAAVVLAGVGLLAGLRTPIRSGLLSVSLLVLWKLYYSAGHGYRFELHRYMSMLLPGLLVMALFAVPELKRLASRLQLGDAWTRGAVVVLLLLCAVDGGYGINAQAYQHEQKRQLMPGNLQVEARWLLMHTRNHPACVFVSPVLRQGAQPPQRYLMFGRPLANPIELDRDPDRLAAELDRVAPDRCAYLYVGRDCYLRDKPGCDDEVSGLRKVEEMRLESRPYNHYHFGVPKPFVPLQLYRLR